MAVLVWGCLCLAPRAGLASTFWNRVVAPERERVGKLVARAQSELDDRALGGPTPGSVARAVTLLEEALGIEPKNFLASVLLGEALALQGRGAQAVARLEHACGLAPSGDDEAWCVLRLAVERSKAGQYAQALKDYDRHLRLGGARPTAYANSAEILMAMGRLREAVDRYREAIRLEELGPRARGRDESLALAFYGLGVTLDRDEQPQAAREAIGRALGLDPKLELLDAAREARPDVFFVPDGDVYYYRGLALAVQGRSGEAADAFGRFVQMLPKSRWRARAEAHVRALTSPPKLEPVAAAVKRGPWRIVASATVRTEGALPAPLVDAAWKGQPGLFAPCFGDLPAIENAASVRVGIDLVFDGAGRVTSVAPELPEAWRDVTACLQERLRGGLRVPRLPRPAEKGKRTTTTAARIELVVARAP